MLGLIGGKQPRGHDHFSDSSGANQRIKAREVVHVEDIAECLRNRQAEAGGLIGNADIAAAGNTKPAASAGAGNGGDHRLGAAFQRAQNLINARFVIQRILGGAEFAELRNIRARSKRLAARTHDHPNANGGVGADFIGQFREPRIHGEGHGIARLRAIESGPGNAAFAGFVQQVFGHGQVPRNWDQHG